MGMGGSLWRSREMIQPIMRGCVSTSNSISQSCAETDYLVLMFEKVEYFF